MGSHPTSCKFQSPYPDCPCLLYCVCTPGWCVTDKEWWDFLTSRNLGHLVHCVQGEHIILTLSRKKTRMMVEVKANFHLKATLRFASENGRWGCLVRELCQPWWSASSRDNGWVHNMWRNTDLTDTRPKPDVASWNYTYLLRYATLCRSVCQSCKNLDCFHKYEETYKGGCTLKFLTIFMETL